MRCRWWVPISCGGHKLILIRIRNRCYFCGITADELEVNITLKYCSACMERTYCSRTCQKKDWRAYHKDNCTEAVESEQQKSLHESPLDVPETPPIQIYCFNDDALLDDTSESFLHDFPAREVYVRLIDTYRLHVEDEYRFNGVTTGLYAGRRPLRQFRKFLDLAESREKLLPSWWSKEARAECESLGMDPREWSNLEGAVEKSDIQEQYDDFLMPLKLRVLAERVYGCPVQTGLKPQAAKGGSSLWLLLGRKKRRILDSSAVHGSKPRLYYLGVHVVQKPKWKLRSCAAKAHIRYWMIRDYLEERSHWEEYM